MIWVRKILLLIKTINVILKKKHVKITWTTQGYICCLSLHAVVKAGSLAATHNCIVVITAIRPWSLDFSCCHSNKPLVCFSQVEAPLMIAPFLQDMTRSELHAVMTGGFATIAGSVLGAFISFGVCISFRTPRPETCDIFA